MKKDSRYIEFCDTTLRDGEQTAGVSFNAGEKFTIAKMLLNELKVDRLEVGSARVSEGEHQALARICSWASQNDCLNKIETLGFIDNDLSINWIYEAGGRVVNLLSKGSMKHLTLQLRKTGKQHVDDILRVVDLATSKGMSVNIYLEDWSNGMRESEEYVYFMVDSLKSSPIRRFMLPDTLGILNPDTTFDYISRMRKRYPDLHFDFHGHNDYDMAVANSMAAVKAGVDGLHVTVNGLGERTGNTPVASVVAMLNDHLHLSNSVDERKLSRACKYVESISGVRIPSNKPIVGDVVFTQAAGVHADGDSKGGLYQSALSPERFGRERQYALGKTSGKANVAKNLELLGIQLSPDHLKLVSDRIVELGDRKELVTKEDLPFIISDVLKGEFSRGEEKIKVINYSLQSTRKMRPVAVIRISIDGEEYEEVSSGAGQYDAFMKALWKVYDKLGREHPVLADYTVSIPPGGKTDALVQTTITWSWKGENIRTRGLDADQTEAAIKATVKMLNLIEE